MGDTEIEMNLTTRFSQFIQQCKHIYKFSTEFKIFKMKVDRNNNNSGFHHNLSYAVLLTKRIISEYNDIYENNNPMPQKLGLERNIKMIFAIFICPETRKPQLKI